MASFRLQLVLFTPNELWLEGVLSMPSGHKPISSGVLSLNVDGIE
jgi:hypothetical protein